MSVGSPFPAGSPAHPVIKENTVMSQYVFLSDSGCDLPVSRLQELDIRLIPMTVTMEGDVNVRADELNTQEMYAYLRSKKMAKTSAISVGEYIDVFESYAAAGKDVYYLAFSSGLSTSYHNALIAAKDVTDKFPERKIVVQDSLSASNGLGLFCEMVAAWRKEGVPLEELEKKAEDIRLRICHQFTVDDLFFLKRGGRISGATALIGTVLQFKPIMHADNEGHLVAIGKVRGRKAAIAALFDQVVATLDKERASRFIIGHGDCLQDAQMLADMVREKLGYTDISVYDIGPTIGAHSGPGTLAIFYVGTER